MGSLRSFSVMVIGVLLFGPAGLPAAESAPKDAVEPAASAKPYLRQSAPTHRNHRRFQTGFLSLRFNPEAKGFYLYKDENDEARLNAQIQDLIDCKPPALSPAEKILQGVYGVASAACGGAAIAQALGVLPDGRQKKK